MVSPQLSQTFIPMRPIFLLIVGWFMATAQVLKRHSSDVERYTPFFFLPAYHIFYQLWTVSALFFIYLSANRKSLREGTVSCADFRDQTSAEWFFKVDLTMYRYTKTMLYIFLLSMVSGIVIVYITRRIVRPQTTKEYRQLLLGYSIYYLFQTLLAYFTSVGLYSFVAPEEELDPPHCPVSGSAGPSLTEIEREAST